MHFSDQLHKAAITMQRIALLSFITLLAACGRAPAEPDSPGAAPSQPVATASSKASFDLAPGDDIGIPATFAINLASDGLVLVDRSGETRQAARISFGDSRATIENQLGRVLGNTAGPKAFDCRTGSLKGARLDAIDLFYLDDRLVGWTARPARYLVTTDGIRPGIALSALQAERPVETTGGGEGADYRYQSPDGGQIAVSVDFKGRIATLSAGDTCL